MTQEQTPTAPNGAARPTVAMLLYPGMTALDLVGPLETLSQMTDVHLIGLTTEEMVSDSGLRFRPTVSIADAPNDVDVLFVPGGEGTAAAMRSPETIEFLADRGARARYVTSVCTGSLVLGAAGLLRGYKATSHWATTHLLAHFGAKPTAGRVVVDRNRITGGGVTAGIDFGLTLLAEMLGEPAARLSQLLIEYDPQPPFNSGSPANADPEHVAFVRKFTDPMNLRIAQDFGPISVPR